MRATRGLAGRITAVFIDSPVTPVLMVLAVAAGLFALSVVPREEEPQIRVPLVDVIVPAPARAPRDALETVTRPLEDIVAGIDGVDHVYSRTRPGSVVVTARFEIGTNSDAAVLRVIERIGANGTRRPAGIPEPTIVGRGIEDVAIVTFTLAPSPQAGDRYDRAAMHDIAQALRWRMTTVDDVGLTYVTGSGPTQLRVTPDPAALARYGIPASRLSERVAAANAAREAGALIDADGVRTVVRAGDRMSSPTALARLAIGGSTDGPVYLSDVAAIAVGPPPPGPLVWHVGGADETPRPAATLAVAKQPGANGVRVAEEALATLEAARGEIVPDDVVVTVTRNYGETASANAFALMWQLAGATATIVVLIGLFVGLREALVVGVIVPLTILLTFLALWLFGYTINRVSLFALIFAIGILVDDAIVVVENITRKWTERQPDTRDAARDIAVHAVDEVGNPTMISTLTIIAALLPMLAVSGLMGPYMAPIPANASAAVLFSTAVALSATPWLILRLRRVRAPLPRRLRDRLPGGRSETDAAGQLYLRVATPLMKTRGRARALLLAMTGATLGSFALVGLGVVPVKLLPFDDKREIQVMLDLPETATIEATDRALRAIADRIAPMDPVESLQIHAGTAAPFNFNGLVRQYYLREAPHLGDVTVNLVPSSERDAQSHAIAGQIRARLSDLDLPVGGALRIAEVPPGPPVFATLLAEIYGPDADSRRTAADRLREVYAGIDYVTDVDDTVAVPRPRLRLVPDRAAMQRHGVSEAALLREIDTLIDGSWIGPASGRQAAGSWPVQIDLSRRDGGALDPLLGAPVPAAQGTVALGRVVDVAEEETGRSIFRRDGRDVVMVQAALAGAREAPIYAMLEVRARLDGSNIETRLRGQPRSPDGPVLLWHGEWDITYTTFRDMGLAFLGAFALIYTVVVAHFRRLALPLVVMMPVPLTLLGVFAGHAVTGTTFTATSMIGFIALAGIVVRNSILLVEFTEARRGEGREADVAALEAGAVRMRPILLTAATAMVGALFIMSDPIFAGLAVSLFFGLISSTLLTVLAVPAVYVWRRA